MLLLLVLVLVVTTAEPSEGSNGTGKEHISAIGGLHHSATSSFPCWTVVDLVTTTIHAVSSLIAHCAEQQRPATILLDQNTILWWNDRVTYPGLACLAA